MEFGIGKDKYNDVFRRLYDAFYRQNIRTDILNPATIDLSRYDLVVVQMLYVTDDQFLERLNDYVRQGGHVLYTFKDGVTDEHVKVRTCQQPGIISEAVGAHYEMFVDPNGEQLADRSGIFQDVDPTIDQWAELLISDGAKVLAGYDNHWKEYAAITENQYGHGMTWYLGCWANPAVIAKLVEHVCQQVGLVPNYDAHFPVIVKSGINEEQRQIDFIFNYSAAEEQVTVPVKGTELLGGKTVAAGEQMTLQPWAVKIIEEQ